MECPKCQHIIHINLTPEELVYCPYCNQRMIPPKEYNLCPVCGEEMGLGAASCENCARNAESGQETVSAGHHPSPSPVAENPEPVSIAKAAAAPVEPAPAPPELKTTVFTSPEPTVEHRVVEEFPPEPVATPEPESYVSASVEELIVSAPQPEIEEIKLVESSSHVPVSEETSVDEVINPVRAPAPAKTLDEAPAIAVPEPETPNVAVEHPAEIPITATDIEPQASTEVETPVQDETSPVHKAESLYSDELLHQLPPGMTPTFKPEPVAGSSESFEAAKASTRQDSPQSEEVNFCFACGQKLPVGSLFCLRCGKSMQIRTAPNSASGLIQEVKPLEKPEQATVAVQPPQKEEPIVTPVPPAQPKYRPVAEREPVAVAMQDVAPSLPHFPKAKTAPDKFDMIWKKITEWFDATWDALRTFAIKTWRLIKALARPAPPKERPLIDLSSAEFLKAKRVRATVKATALNPTMLIYLILGTFLFVAIFIIIGMAMTR